MSYTVDIEAQKEVPKPNDEAPRPVPAWRSWNRWPAWAQLMLFISIVIVSVVLLVVLICAIDLR